MSTATRTETATGGKGAVTRDLSGKYLTFRLAKQEYGVQILKVREIIGLMEFTLVPRMPPFVRGVINLRGKVIPVVDLRAKFSLEKTEDTKVTCIIVVDVEAGGGKSGGLMGILVDTVSEVLDITNEQVEPPPSLGPNVDTSFILAMAKVKDSVKILLDIERVLSAQELSALLSM